MAANPAAIADIETLKKRYRELDRQKTTAEANQKTAEEQIAKIKQDALAKFGTDDLDALKKKLAEMMSSNDKKRAEYQNQLDAIENKLAEIERQYESDDDK